MLVPAVAPQNVPVVAPIVPMDGVPLVHVPPVEVVASVVHCPTHVVAVPVMGAGNGFVVIVLVL